MPDLAFHRNDAGVALTEQALSPKNHGGWHTMWWTGPQVEHPLAAIWSTDPAEAVRYPTEAAAVDAFAALRNPGYQLPEVQLQLDTEELFDVDEPGAPAVDQPALFDDPPSSPVLVEVCPCLRTRGEGEGFTNAREDGGEWWVHVGCRRPTAQYVAAMASR